MGGIHGGYSDFLINLVKQKKRETWRKYVGGLRQEKKVMTHLGQRECERPLMGIYVLV